jgi:RNA-directed DNA polymerase
MIWEYITGFCVMWMKRIIDLSNEEAKEHFLKASSYFNNDMPDYISFEPILQDVIPVLDGGDYKDFQKASPGKFPCVNYMFLTNKDGHFAWRPLELIHPAIYISLVNTICDTSNWSFIQERFFAFQNGVVDCCGDPVLSLDQQSDTAAQIRSWWQQVEQRSLAYSLKFSHILHTDVADCYGSLYTHSIAWALHGKNEAKERIGDKNLLGNKIDKFIQDGRYGQTNGISQGSVLMDFIAEIVLGYVDMQINSNLEKSDDFRVLRYRDDYRIFANSDDQAEYILKIISNQLRDVGMKLGVSKTHLSRNVVDGSIKPDKLAGIDLKDKGKTNADTIQKQLLRLHSFGCRFPNSGALRRLLSYFNKDIDEGIEKLDDLEVLVAITTDIGYVSPSTIPAVAAILSHLICQASSKEEKKDLWNKVYFKMKRVPYNGYLEVWLQRVTQSKGVNLQFASDEPICKIVNKEKADLWENGWISNPKLKQALNVSKIIVGDVSEYEEVIAPEEIELFTENAWFS